MIVIQKRKFISEFGKVKNGIKLKIVNDEILELKLVDNYDNNVVIKLNLGIHKNVSIVQEKIGFSLDTLNESVVLPVNLKKQIFVKS